MSVQPKKNLIQKFLYMAGVASASVCLNIPAFALTTPNPSTLNLDLSDRISSADPNLKSIDLLAQTGNQSPSGGGGGEIPPDGGDRRSPGGGGSTLTPSPSGGGSNSTTPSSSPGGSSTTPPDPTGGNRRTPAPTNTTPSTGGSSSGSSSGPEKGSWACLNNPNPVCRS
jgi:hypothetical protein